MFFYIDLERNSSSPEGAAFSRPDVPGSGPTEGGMRWVHVYLQFLVEKVIKILRIFLLL